MVVDFHARRPDESGDQAATDFQLRSMPTSFLAVGPRSGLEPGDRPARSAPRRWASSCSHHVLRQLRSADLVKELDESRTPVVHITAADRLRAEDGHDRRCWRIERHAMQLLMMMKADQRLAADRVLRVALRVYSHHRLREGCAIARVCRKPRTASEQVVQPIHLMRFIRVIASVKVAATARCPVACTPPAVADALAEQKNIRRRPGAISDRWMSATSPARTARLRERSRSSSVHS